MNERKKKVLMNMTIILGPVLIIMLLLQTQLTTISQLNTWDVAISIGAMMTVLIFLFIREKK
jgi:hypothetical protein